MVGEDPKRSSPNGEKGNCVFSPGFRSVAAMAGWDEEALLMASLVVEDTPDRDVKQKRRSDPLFKTPPTNSRRKRRDQRKSPVSMPVVVLNLDEEEGPREEIAEEKKEQKLDVEISRKKDEKSNESRSQSSSIPCIDRLREELSCAICLEICFEPSTTSCGHSFCKKCLRSAADKCGKRCPKCRQLISNGRSCTINTVLWNTIQLLFPQEIEARKGVAGASSKTLDSGDLQSPPPRRRSQYRSVIEALNSPEGEQLSMERRRRTSNNHHQHNLRQQSFRPASVVLLNSREAGANSVSRRRRRREVVVVGPPEQDEDAALALRLQREEFMGAFGGGAERPQQQQQQQQQDRRNSVATAAVNLRAMASRAVGIRNLRGGR